MKTKVQHTQERGKGYAAGDATRDDIIRAAGELAGKYGFETLTTRAIASRAKVNIGSIHYHFGGKAGLLDALVEHVLCDWVERPLSELIATYEPILNTARGQVLVIRAVVHRHLDGHIKDRARLQWHHRVVYQLMQHRELDLSEKVMSTILDPHLHVLTHILSVIDPSLNKDDILQLISLILSPICFHSDYMDMIGQELGTDEYSSEYLEKLEYRIAMSILLLLGFSRAFIDGVFEGEEDE